MSAQESDPVPFSEVDIDNPVTRGPCDGLGYAIVSTVGYLLNQEVKQ